MRGPGSVALGLHAWQSRLPSDRAREDRRLLGLIGAIHDDSRGTYGARPVHAELRLEHGIGVGRKRVERLMRHACLSGMVHSPPRPHHCLGAACAHGA